MEEVLANIDHLEGLVDTQLRQLGPQVETLRALRNAEETRREGLQLLLEQRRLAADADQSERYLPPSIRLSRQALEAHRQAFHGPLGEQSPDEGSPTSETDRPAPSYEVVAAALDAYSPAEGPLAQVERATRIVEAVLGGLQQNLGAAEARHVDTVLDLRRQLEVGRRVYQQELQTLKQVVAQQEKRTQAHAEYLEAAKARVEEAVQERKVAAMKPRYQPAEEAEDTTLLSPHFSEDEGASDTSSSISTNPPSGSTTRSSSAQPARSASAPRTQPKAKPNQLRSKP